MKVLFVHGPEKTATSTLTGILNCHPEIFILFETYLAQPSITKYGNQLLDRYPDARHYFRLEEDYGVPVLDFFNYLKKEEPNYNYKYVGTKINSLDPETTQKVKDHKIIFTKRDLRSWLIKQSIIKLYRTDLDVVVPTIEYLRYIIQSARYKHAHHVWLEDLVKKNDEMISGLADYLGIELSGHTESYWEQIGYRAPEDPKSMFKLDHVHHSSRVKPEGLDSSYELKKDPFWADANRIFDKYFKVTDVSPFSDEEIENDLKSVENLREYGPKPFMEVYNKVKSLRIGFSKPREVYFSSDTDKTGKKKSLILRIIERVKRIAEVGFNNYHISKGIGYGFLIFDEVQLIIELLMFN